MVTLVFFGGTMIDGAMGSAGPPTSITHTHRRQIEKREKIYKAICRAQMNPLHLSGAANRARLHPYTETDNLSLAAAGSRRAITQPLTPLSLL